MQPKDVIAILSGLVGIASGIVSLAKTIDWWKGLQAYQLVFAGAVVYLLWWAFDRYQRSNLNAIRETKADLTKALQEARADLSKTLTNLSTKVDDLASKHNAHVKEQTLQRHEDQTELNTRLGKVENANTGLERAIFGVRDDLSEWKTASRLSFDKIEKRLSALEGIK